eukprot:528438_1
MVRQKLESPLNKQPAEEYKADATESDQEEDVHKEENLYFEYLMDENIIQIYDEKDWQNYQQDVKTFKQRVLHCKNMQFPSPQKVTSTQNAVCANSHHAISQQPSPHNLFSATAPLTPALEAIHEQQSMGFWQRNQNQNPQHSLMDELPIAGSGSNAVSGLLSTGSAKMQNPVQKEMKLDEYCMKKDPYNTCFDMMTKRTINLQHECSVKEEMDQLEEAYVVPNNHRSKERQNPVQKEINLAHHECIVKEELDRLEDAYVMPNNHHKKLQNPVQKEMSLHMDKKNISLNPVSSAGGEKYMTHIKAALNITNAHARRKEGTKAEERKRELLSPKKRLLHAMNNEITCGRGKHQIENISAENEHTVQVNILSIYEKEFEFKQFHFHTHSEHTIDSRAYEMEMHLVHVNEVKEICVL